MADMPSESTIKLLPAWVRVRGPAMGSYAARG